MVRVGHEHDLIVVQVNALRVRVRERAEDAHLYFVREKHVEDLLRAAGADDDVDERVFAAEAVEDSRQHVGGDRYGGAEAQGAELHVAHVLDGVAALL